MTQPERAFERLQQANPHSVTEVDRLTGQQFLTVVDAAAFEPIRTTTRRTWPAIAAAVVVVMAAIPIVLYGTGEPDPPPADTPIEFAPNIPLLVDEIHFSGEYRVDQLGTQFTITPDVSWGHTIAKDGYVTIVNPNHAGELTFIRATGLSNPDNPFTSINDAPWPIGDITGWLDRLDSRVDAADLVTVQLDGSEVLQFDVAVADGAPCISESACAAFVTNHKIDSAPLIAGQSHRVWWILQGDLDPIVVVASGDAEFIDSATSLVNTVKLGPSRPHPVAAGNVWESGHSAEVKAGTVRLPALGGVQLELEHPQYLYQTTDRITVEISSLAGVEISYVRTGPLREPIATIADFRETMSNHGVSLTTIGEPETRLPSGEAFDLVRGPDVELNLAFSGDPAGLKWIVPATGRLWLFETSRGVLMVSAGSREGTFGLDEAIALAEQIVPTLILIDPQTLGR